MNEIVESLNNIKQLLNDIKTLLEEQRTIVKKRQVVKSEAVENKETVEAVFRSYTDNEGLLKSLLDFAESRKIAKSAITVRAANLLLKKLDELGKTTAEKIQLVEQSTMNGWKSIYPLSNKFGAVKQTTFNNYEQRDENYDEIEKRALQARISRKEV